MREREMTCPRCGRGTLVDLSFDQGSAGDPPLTQTADSHEILTFTCGHTWVEGSLSSADQRRLDVERRRSDETVMPGPDERGPSS